MGRSKSDIYKKSLSAQSYDKFAEMFKNGAGQSKSLAKKDGSDADKIFSKKTFETYCRQAKGFCDYVKENHPDCTTLKKAKIYVNEYLQHRVEHGGKKGQELSAWTLTLDRQALHKLYGIKPGDDNFFKAPDRRRVDIKRSRGDAERARHFSEKNNQEFVDFCRSTGCRRNVVGRLEGRDLVSRSAIEKELADLKSGYRDQKMPDKVIRHEKALEDALRFFPGQENFLHHRNDKGGRERYAPIIGENAGAVIEKMKNTPEGRKVWESVPSNADIHSYRADYANELYRQNARPLSEIPYDRINKGSGHAYQSGVYCCQGDLKGVRLDRQAMLAASKALGHNRIDVIADYYIRG